MYNDAILHCTSIFVCVISHYIYHPSSTWCCCTSHTTLHVTAVEGDNYVFSNGTLSPFNLMLLWVHWWWILLVTWQLIEAPTIGRYYIHILCLVLWSTFIIMWFTCTHAQSCIQSSNCCHYTNVIHARTHTHINYCLNAVHSNAVTVHCKYYKTLVCTFSETHACPHAPEIKIKGLCYMYIYYTERERERERERET